MVRVGLHVSIVGGIDKAVDRARDAGCDDFQIFSRNPRGWSSRELAPEEIERFVEKLKAYGLNPAVDHMPYLPNLASPKDEIYSKSVDILSTELQRCGSLHIPYLVTHLGSHTGSGWDEGLRRVAGAVKNALSGAENDATILLENTAGTKNSMGSSFEDIGAILEAVDSERVGVCLDTCHAFAAGYELRTKEGFEATLAGFDEVIGLQRLKLIHLNDSKGGLGSHLDRHEHIGLGEIGEEGFATVLGSNFIRDLPLILETPVDSRRDDVGNIKTVRDLASRPGL